ncbi:MAG: hypothetical protein DHS20C18_05690 [Saprospiraceae bacterium]|nr:MAG: hypothetical protein DHS20C18_05690 [Saprospiraceae bacterium]
MTHYFKLQYKMLNRHLSEFGVHPVVGYLLGLLCFVGLSVYLFYKTAFASYIYVFLAISLLVNPGKTKRNDFLKSCFSKLDYLKTRLLENLILVAPFVGFLLYRACFGEALVLLIGSGGMAFLNFSRPFTQVLPTPFYKQPFEFTVGFRRTFLVIFFAYFLTYMAIAVNNFNLGIFAILLVLFTCLSYYFNPENRFFVWIFSLSPRNFLWQKIKVALLSATLLCLPIDLCLAVFFPEYIKIVIGVQILGYLYLLTIILGKYSAFPRALDLPQGILIAISVWLPPFLLGIIPFFYVQAIKRLKEILE